MCEVHDSEGLCKDLDICLADKLAEDNRALRNELSAISALAGPYRDGQGTAIDLIAKIACAALSGGQSCETCAHLKKGNYSCGAKGATCDRLSNWEPKASPIRDNEQEQK